MKYIGIIGARRRNTPMVRRLIEGQLWSIYEEGDILVSGGCEKGGDRFAEEIAKAYGLPLLIFYPDYKKHGRGAPFMRNTSIANQSDIIIACVVNPEDGIDEVLLRKKGGTEDTLSKFAKRLEHNKKKVLLI